MKHLFLAIIRFYRKYLSPLKRPSCRYYPTCSAYAYEAITKYGAWKGGYLAARRLLRCHPLSKRAYYDPVPKSQKNK